MADNGVGIVPKRSCHDAHLRSRWTLLHVHWPSSSPCNEATGVTLYREEDSCLASSRTTTSHPPVESLTRHRESPFCCFLPRSFRCWRTFGQHCTSAILTTRKWRLAKSREGIVQRLALKELRELESTRWYREMARAIRRSLSSNRVTQYTQKFRHRLREPGSGIYRHRNAEIVDRLVQAISWPSSTSRVTWVWQHARGSRV